MDQKKTRSKKTKDVYPFDNTLSKLKHNWISYPAFVDPLCKLIRWSCDGDDDFEKDVGDVVLVMFKWFFKDSGWENSQKVDVSLVVISGEDEVEREMVKGQKYPYILRLNNCNGRTVSMWFDNWSSIGPLHQYITYRDLYDARLDVDLKVSEMVRDNNWVWPSEWYRKFNVVTNIEVPDINPNKCDEVVWKTSSGMEKDFAVKNVCRELRSNVPVVTWWKLVWYSQCIPKHAFILWIAINNRMNTQDRLQKWGYLELVNVVIDANELNLQYLVFEEDEEDKWYHLDVSRMIKEYKSKVEKELLQVCNKVSHPAVKQAFTRHLADVKAGTIPAQNHRPHLHNKDEKRMSTKQKFKANDVIRAAADNINDVMKELRDIIISSKSVDDDKDVSSIIKECRSKVVNQLQYICDNNVSSYNQAFVHIKSKIHEWYHLDVSRMIKEYKSKVEKELLQVCNKVSHPAVKQAFTRHLADVKAGTIPAQNHRPHLHNKDEKRMSTKQKMRFIQKKKRSRLLMRRRELISVKHKPPLFLEHHRHSQFCFKNNYFDRMYGHLRKSPPKEEEDSEPEFVECDDIDDV
ncbi:RNA-directed DNA polymerase, eukaryota, Reverse transcriptase zinc-binding domain protein [Artemisia annua]|uniref:RNA-directed DNA polymerase, eukaryota, Reverse transcriptase zinc-binding domain protein n=1 Tax=Artemisia annua TaxID=35608 RepID=A0A2U1KUT9_ARTAN|nr:RNA-directed DNA polymerase, eukaryota, Reverse transcriptase zinc-binding domain protein [Artemisia annua]